MRRDIPLLFNAAGLMVPDPSTSSPPMPFIEAGTDEWEVPYIADGRTDG